MKELIRCPWARSEPDAKYHDEEWGVPVRDDRLLFEMLTLEGAQAGLSWTTVLRRREGYRATFHNFDLNLVANLNEQDCQRILAEANIVKNRAKVYSTVSNAKAFIKVQDEFGSFSNYLWRFVDGKPIQNAWTELGQVPAETELSKALSKDLKKRGFSFVGGTICYAYAQAVGLVNDHLVDCPRYLAVQNG